LKNTTFQEKGKTTGQGNAISSKERHFSPLAVILENRSVTLFHWVDMVSVIHPVGITQNEHFLSLDCSSRGVIYTEYKHKCYDVKNILPEFPSPGYQFLVFFRSLWCKG
jgi:hypothetical protein